MTVLRGNITTWSAERWFIVGLLATLLALAFGPHVAGASEPTKSEPELVPIVSSWEGAFYAGRWYGDHPFVEVGSAVEPATMVGTIQGMRRFEVYAGIRGTIAKVVVSDGEPVYMGQTLFLVQPIAEPKSP